MGRSAAVFLRRCCCYCCYCFAAQLAPGLKLTASQATVRTCSARIAASTRQNQPCLPRTFAVQLDGGRQQLCAGWVSGLLACCCPFCWAQWKHLPSYCLADNGRRRTMKTHTRWQLSVAGSPPSILCAIPGWHKDRCLHDCMRGQNLCTAQYLCGNALRRLSDCGFFGPGDLETRLRAAYAAFKRWRKIRAIACSQPRFTPARIRRSTAGEFPCLDSKAHNCKVALCWLAAATKRAAAQAAPEWRQELQLLATCT